MSTGIGANAVDMTYDDVIRADPDAVDDWRPEIAALVLDRAGRWDAAHERASAHETSATNRVHAYLHRKEGDAINARYWYERVGEPVPQTSLQTEWSDLVRRFAADAPGAQTDT